MIKEMNVLTRDRKYPEIWRTEFKSIKKKYFIVAYTLCYGFIQFKTFEFLVSVCSFLQINFYMAI